MLGGRVEPAPSVGNKADDAAEIQDNSGVLDSHRGQNGSNDGEGSEDVGLKHVSYLLDRGVLNHAAQAIAGIIGENIDSSPFRNRRVNGRPNLVRLGDIHGRSDQSLWILGR